MRARQDIIHTTRALDAAIVAAQSEAIDELLRIIAEIPGDMTIIIPDEYEQLCRALRPGEGP